MTRRILLTRPQADAAGFTARLPRGWQAHIAPMQVMVDLPADPNFTKVDALVFTSANAVRSYARRWAGHKLPAYCVGDSTAAAAQKAGLRAVSAGGDSADLTALLADLPPQNLLYLHGHHVRATLTSAAHTITALALYDQQAVPLDMATKAMLAAGEITAAALFSPRSAALLAADWQNGPKLTCFCLSQAVAAAAAPLGPCQIAAQPNADSLLAIISTYQAE